MMVCYRYQRTCQWILWLNYRAPYLHRQTLSKFPLVNSITHCCGNISLHDHEERSHTGISYSVFNAFYLSYNTLDHLTTASIEIFNFFVMGEGYIIVIWFVHCYCKSLLQKSFLKYRFGTHCLLPLLYGRISVGSYHTCEWCKTIW